MADLKNADLVKTAVDAVLSRVVASHRRHTLTDEVLALVTKDMQAILAEAERRGAEKENPL